MKGYAIIKEDKHFRSVKLYYFCLFFLSFAQFIYNISIFTTNSIFLWIRQLVEIVCYFLLIYVILNKGYRKNTLLLIIGITCLLTYGMIRSHMSAFLFAWLLIVAAKGENYDRLIKILYQSMLLTFSISIFCYLCTVDFETFTRQLGSGFDLGFGQKNQAGLFLAYLYLMRKTWKKKHISIFKDFLYGIIVFLITKSKTATIVILLYPLLKKIFEYTIKHDKKIIKLFTKLLVPTLFIFTYVSAKNFLNNTFIQFLDKILTNRIFLNWFILDKSNLTFWGQNVQLNYTGVYNPVRGVGNITTTVDNAYMLFMLIMGIVPTLLFIFGYIKIIEIAWKEKKTEVIVMAIIFALYGVAEVKTINIFFNFVYLYIFCNQYTNKQNILFKRRLIYDS